ncbi:FAD binding domain-containing protein [Aspergillus egyptiacus]|nr:FAD binding domain-containing protein [Aspergillus egyptiacus]
MAESSVDVLIVGAVRSSRLTTALWLANLGIDFRIIDKRSSTPRRGQADGLSPRTMEILEAFGIDHEVTRQWEPATDEILWERDGHGTLVRMDRVRNQPAVGVRWGHGTLQQGVVEEIMKRKITGVCGVEVQYETQLLDLVFFNDQAGDHEGFAWTATVESSGRGSRDTIQARYIIGADGARSAVRSAIGITMEGNTGQAVWGVMDIAGSSDLPDDVDGAVDFVRREQDRTRMYVELNRTAAGWEGLGRDSITPEAIIEKCRHIMRPYQLDVEDCVWWSAFTVSQRISSALSVQDRGFLVGDAVHTHSPLCGAGMNTAVQDAYNLGWKLAGVIKGQLNPGILQTYEAERRPVAEALLDADRTILDLFHAPRGPEAQALLEKAPAVQLYLSGRATSYGETLLTCPAARRLGAFVPGECLPDVVVHNYTTGRPSNLHSWIKTDGSWALILWAGDLSSPLQMERVQCCAIQLETTREKLVARASSILDAFLVHRSEWPRVELGDLPRLFVPAKGKGLDHGRIFVDQGSVYDTVGIDHGHGGIVVVRPDKYIGWTGGLEEVNELEECLSRLFHQTGCTEIRN